MYTFYINLPTLETSDIIIHKIDGSCIKNNNLVSSKNGFWSSCFETYEDLNIFLKDFTRKFKNPPNFRNCERCCKKL